MLKSMLAFWNDEEGASLVEYALLLGLIAVVALVTLKPLGDKVAAMFAGVDGKLTPPQ